MIVTSAQAEPIANLANHEASRNRGRGSRFEGSGAIRPPRLDVKVRIINDDSKISKAGTTTHKGSNPMDRYNQ